MKKFTPFFLLLFPFNLVYSQIFKRDIILKNNVLEAKQYDINLKTNQKVLLNILYFNDSGLVEKAINFTINLDSIINFSLDTAFITTLEYDSLNREVNEIGILRDKKYIHKTEYINKNTIKTNSLINGSDDTYISKTRKRKHLIIIKSYFNGFYDNKVRTREFAHKIIRRQTNTFNKTLQKKYRYRKVKTIVKLDSLGRNTNESLVYKDFFFIKKRSKASTTYNGDLLEKVCGNYTNGKSYCYTYDYKKGIKLKKE